LLLAFSNDTASPEVLYAFSLDLPFCPIVAPLSSVKTVSLALPTYCPILPPRECPAIVALSTPYFFFAFFKVSYEFLYRLVSFK